MDVDKEMEKVQDVERYSNAPVEIAAGVVGPSANRSIVKSAVALACEAGLKPTDCDIAIEYLRNEENEYDEDGFWDYYQEDLVKNREDGLPLHCVHVAACPDSGLLLGYVEYYGMVRRVIVLSKAYKGKPVRRTYCVNPVDGQKLSDVEVNLDDSTFEVVKNQTSEGLRAGLLKAVNQIMRSGVLLSRSRTIARQISGILSTSETAPATQSANLALGDSYVVTGPSGLIGLVFEQDLCLAHHLPEVVTKTQHQHSQFHPVRLLQPDLQRLIDRPQELLRRHLPPHCRIMYRNCKSYRLHKRHGRVAHLFLVMLCHHFPLYIFRLLLPCPRTTSAL